jgi:hypothetical protein
VPKSSTAKSKNAKTKKSYQKNALTLIFKARALMTWSSSKRTVTVT